MDFLQIVLLCDRFAARFTVVNTTLCMTSTWWNYSEVEGFIEGMLCVLFARTEDEGMGRILT
jgi:hypothetical protein